MFLFFLMIYAYAAPFKSFEVPQIMNPEMQPLNSLEKFNYNIHRWQDVKKDLLDLKENIDFGWFNKLRKKLGLEEIKPWLFQNPKFRNALSDRTVLYIDDQIQVLKEQISKTEKKQNDKIVEDEYVEILTPQVQEEIDQEVEEQFVKITQDEILQVLQEQWYEYQTIPEVSEQIYAEWMVLGDPYKSFTDIL